MRCEVIGCVRHVRGRVEERGEGKEKKRAD
jgi:hypothetical protein